MTVGTPLPVGRFLGVRGEDLSSGRALARLGVLGALFVVTGFLVPVALERHSHGYRFPWDLWQLEGAPTLALASPLLLALVGLIAAMPRLPAQVRAALLLGGGLLGLWALGELGPFAACARRVLHPIPVGALIAGAGAMLRLYDPFSLPGRGLLAGGVIILAVGYAVPTDVSCLVPQEMLPYARYRDVATDATPPVMFFARMLSLRSGPALFHALLGLAPLVSAAGALLVAWPRPMAVWDLAGRRLRPLAWILVLSVPLGYAFGVFVMTGWQSRAADLAFLGRLRLLTLSLPLTLWVAFAAARLAMPAGIRTASAASD